MHYPQEAIEDIRAGNDIADVVGGYVELKSRGGKLFGLCPFHSEKTPSFSVSSDRQMYYCFGCGAGGNVISFIMQIENYDFIDSVKFLADRINYILPQAAAINEHQKKQLRSREVLREINKAAARFYYDTLQADTIEAESARQYLNIRGIHPKLRKVFGLGLSPKDWDRLISSLKNFKPEDLAEAGLVKLNKNGGYYDRFRGRLMFPIMDIDGHVVGFGAREMDGDGPKYLNSPETVLFDKSRQLYGIHAARKSRRKEIIIVEGYMDVLSLNQAGFAQTVGVLGTALTSHHSRLLKRINCETVILLFDRDTAGVNAVLKAIPILLEAGFKVKCLQVTEDTNDPDEFLQKHGPARFGQLLEQAKSHAAFRIDLLAKEYNLQNTEQRILFTQEAAKALASIQSTIEADAYIQETAKLTGIAPQAIQTEMDKQRAPRFTRTNAPRDRLKLRIPKNERGVVDARKGILSILMTSPSANLIMQEHLSPKEMGDGIGPKLLELIYKNCEKSAADIITRFETLEEQKQAAEMLKDSLNFEDHTALEKALNEMWKTIKRAHFKSCMEEIEQTDGEVDINLINTLGIALRNLEKQYITIANG